jgi:DNA-binding beta-propeller fold protein YncE
VPQGIRRAAALAALALCGCGSASTVAELPPAAGADRSPPATAPPAGRVVDRGGPLPAEPVVAAGRSFTLEGTQLVADGGDSVRVASEPAGLAASGNLVAVLSGRERVLEVFDARTLMRVGRASAGAGPTHVAAGESRFYVVDTAGDGLLVFRWEPELELTRRVALPGAPFAIAVDRERSRLWVTLTGTNEVAELTAGTRPGVQRTLPAVRQPDEVAVDADADELVVRGADAAQRLDLSA